MHITRHNEAVLTLELECNPHVDEALVKAFHKACPKLTVENVKQTQSNDRIPISEDNIPTSEEIPPVWRAIVAVDAGKFAGCG